MLRDPEHRHGDYQRTEPLSGRRRLPNAHCGTALADLIHSLLRLRIKSRGDIRLVTHALDIIVAPEIYVSTRSLQIV